MSFFLNHDYTFLQQEQHAHAETRMKLMEVTDKLDFTLSEVDILSKQLTREKDTFQNMWVLLLLGG